MSDFLEQIDRFINQLTSAQGSLEDQIYLQECDMESTLAKIRTVSDYQEWGKWPAIELSTTDHLVLRVSHRSANGLLSRWSMAYPIELVLSGWVSCIQCYDSNSTN